MESVRSVPEEGGGEEEEEGGELDHPFIAILILSGLHPNAAKSQTQKDVIFRRPPNKNYLFIYFRPPIVVSSFLPFLVPKLG